jgi:ubiquinone/menaquinone biosynthesis C-methylase UbiE
MMAKMGMEVSGSDYSESMLEMAKRNLSGFREIRFYGDYHRNPYSDESRRLIVVAK